MWEADDEVLVRPVAVKILHRHLAVDTAFVERFRHEAIAAARLSHPSIVSIYDTISDQGDEAIVMELVQGTTLRRRLDKVRTLTTREAVAVGSQVADALDTAHRAHVVHRDIKPANILLSTDGRVLVADFGIAKALEGADLTAEGAMVGTAKYLAPEQVEATGVDGRTDLYSLGIVLYEALCGEVPFHADTDTATALARLHKAPLRPRQINPAIPLDLEDVVMRAMARHPDDRYEDAAQMRAALLDCIDGPRAALVDTVDPDHTVVTDVTAITGGSTSDDTPVPERDLVTPPPSFSRSKRGWLVPTLVILLVAVALVVAGVLIGQSRQGDPITASVPTTTRPTTTPADLPIASASSFDPPPGDGTENDDMTALVLDDDPATAWRTSTYEDGAEMRLKPGVGLVLSLEDTATLDTLAISSPSAGWNTSIYVHEGAIPDTLEGWGTPVTGKSDLEPGTTTFALDGHKARHVLIWITRLTDEGRVEISGVTLHGAT